MVRGALEGTHNLDSLGTLQVLQDALNAINNPNNAGFIYATRTRAQQLQQRVQRFLNDPQALNQLLINSWVPICQLFSRGQNRQRLFTYSGQQPGIINMLLGSAGATGPRPVIVIDISRQGNQRFWSEELQRRILGKLLNIPAGHVNVKATTADHLGFIGRGEGICAMAVVLIETGETDGERSPIEGVL